MTFGELIKSLLDNSTDDFEIVVRQENDNGETFYSTVSGISRVGGIVLIEMGDEYPFVPEGEEDISDPAVHTAAIEKVLERRPDFRDRIEQLRQARSRTLGHEVSFAEMLVEIVKAGADQWVAELDRAKEKTRDISHRAERRGN